MPAPSPSTNLRRDIFNDFLQPFGNGDAVERGRLRLESREDVRRRHARRERCAALRVESLRVRHAPRHPQQDHAVRRRARFFPHGKSAAWRGGGERSGGEGVEKVAAVHGLLAVSHAHAGRIPVGLENSTQASSASAGRTRSAQPICGRRRRSSQRDSWSRSLRMISVAVIGVEVRDAK